MDIHRLAAELLDAHRQATLVTPPSQQDPGFDLPEAYAVAAEVYRMRWAAGYQSAGRKIGFTNKSIWAEYGLDTPIWGHVYTSSVRYAEGNVASVSLAGLIGPRIEPEIVFKLRSAVPLGVDDPEQLLQAAEWLALGFEIVDCPYPGWQFRPADAVAYAGLHAALVIGEPLQIEGRDLAQLAGQLRDFRIALIKDGEVAANGAGQNVLGSPILALSYLAAMLSGQPEAEPLAAGEVVTTGTLTAALPIKAGETWAAEVTGIDLPRLTVAF